MSARLLAMLPLAVACSSGGGANDVRDSSPASVPAVASADTGSPQVVPPAVVAAPSPAARDSAPAPVPAEGQPEYRPGTNPWDASRARGASFRGIGQEPGWIVEVFPGRSLVALLDYGERTITAPWVAPQRGSAGRVTFTSATAAGTLVVDVTPVPCADAMSGERMTHTVVLRYGSDEYRGCGRVLGGGWPER